MTEDRCEGGAALPGLVLVLTGNGKGKTTAALGMVLRAAGHGQRAAIIQFLKGGRTTGELNCLRTFIPAVTVIQAGVAGFTRRKAIQERDREAVREGLAAARACLAGDYDLVVLDEVNVAVHYGLIGIEELLDLLRARRPGQTVVLTGRHASPPIVAYADTVSEIREVKHHLHSGMRARAGIEF